MADPAHGGQGEVRAAGGVLWRPAAGGVEVALVHRPRYDDWSFPKGKRMPGEHILLTAAREVAEETGAHPALGRWLATASYQAHGRPKRVDYWAAWPRAAGSSFTPNDEVDELGWLGLAAARERLSYRRDVHILDGFAAGPAQTTPLIFLRHAATVSRKTWADAGEQEDLDRPLSDVGRKEADALGQILNCYPPARVISSAARRCLASVSPYAALTGASVEIEPAFTPDPGPPSPDPAEWRATPAAAARIAEAARGAQPVVISGHRENLPWLLARACERLGAPVPQGPPLGKGAFWVLHASAGSLISAERHETRPAVG